MEKKERKKERNPYLRTKKKKSNCKKRRERRWKVGWVSILHINHPDGLSKWTTGTGTCYNTYIPCFSYKNILENFKRIIKGEDKVKEFLPMTPWYKEDIVELFTKN